MVSSVQNSSIANPQMKAPELRVGVITPPDKFYKPVLFSDAEASQKFNKLNQDVYAMQKKISFEETKKTPKSVFWILGTGLLAVAGFLVRALFKSKA